MLLYDLISCFSLTNKNYIHFEQSDLVHTIGESAALGAAGVVLWGSSEYARSQVLIIYSAVNVS